MALCNRQILAALVIGAVVAPLGELTAAPGPLAVAAEVSDDAVRASRSNAAEHPENAVRSAVTTGVATAAQIDNDWRCSDTQTVSGPNPIKDCFRVLQSFGGATVSGVRQAVEGYALLTSPTSPANRTRYYVGGTFTSEAKSGDGGFATALASRAPAGAVSIAVVDASHIIAGQQLTIDLASSVNGGSAQSVVAGTPRGRVVPIAPALQSAAEAGAGVRGEMGEMQGLTAQSVLSTGARYLDAAVGMEANITAARGTAPRVKTWLGAVNNSADSDPGAQWDAAIGISSASPVRHARTGILFAPYAGHFPVETSGTMIGAYSGAQPSTYSIANGIDLTGVWITGAAFASQTNSATVVASTAQPGFALQGNLSHGAAELDLVNTYVGADVSLAVVQKTGPESYTTPFSVASNGNTDVIGVLAAQGGVRLPSVPVAKLPRCDVARRGLMFMVVDAFETPAYRGVAKGGGTQAANVTCTGAEWLYM